MSKRSSKGPRNAPSHHGAAPATGSARPGMIWALLAAAILAWFVPFVFWDADVLRTFDASAVLLSACALVAVTSLVFDRESVGPTLSRAAVAWSVFLAWLLLAGAVSGRPWAAFVGESTGRLGWASLVCVTLIAVAASARADGLSRALSSVAPWLVGSQAIVVAGQLLAGRTARGTFPNSSYLAEALLLVLPWTVHAAGAAVQRRPWRIAVGALGVVTLAIAGARVGLVVAATWYGWQVVSDSELTRAARRWVVAGVALMAVAGAFAFAGGEIASVLGPAAFGDRPSMWRLGAAAVAARPVFGWGADGFFAGGASAMTVERVRAGTALAFGPAAVDPHNIALWIAVSAGLVGLAVAAWFAVEWIRASTVGNARADARAASSRWAVGGVLVLALTAPVAVQVLPVLGLVAGVGAMRGGTLVVRPRRVRFLMLTLGGIVALLVAGNALSRMPYEHPSADVSAELAPGAGKAASLWALDAHLAHLASDHWAYATESDPAVGSAQLDRVWASRAVARDAHDPTHALALARTLRFYGEAPEDVEAEFLECLRRWPTYPLGAAEYAAFLAEQDRDAEARTQLEIARLAGEPAGATMNAIRYAEDLLRR